MFKKKKKEGQTQIYHHYLDGTSTPLVLPEVLYVTDEIYYEIKRDHRLTMSSSLVEAAKKSSNHKVGVYQLINTTCVEYVQPEPIVRTIDCPQEEK